MDKPKYNIIVIGAGGTGTYFLKEFSRFLCGTSSVIDSFSIFDGDVVENKNLARQAFTADDIGFIKSTVMADVLSSSFNVPWQAYPTYLTEISQLEKIEKKDTIPLIVGCVDNHGCRLLLEEYFNKCDNICYLDSANEFSTGEVIFSYKANGKILSPTRSFYFPKIKESDTRNRTEISCEELNNVSPQHIATNMCAGNILLKEVTALMDGKAHLGMVTFDLDSYYQEFFPYGGNMEQETA